MRLSLPLSVLTGPALAADKQNTQIGVFGMLYTLDGSVQIPERCQPVQGAIRVQYQGAIWCTVVCAGRKWRKIIWRNEIGRAKDIAKLLFETDWMGWFSLKVTGKTERPGRGYLMGTLFSAGWDGACFSYFITVHHAWLVLFTTRPNTIDEHLRAYHIIRAYHIVRVYHDLAYSAKFIYGFKLSTGHGDGPMAGYRHPIAPGAGLAGGMLLQSTP